MYGDWKQAVSTKTTDHLTLADWDKYVPKLRRAVRSEQIQVQNEEVIKAMLQHIMEWIRNKINTKMAAWARGKRQFWISGLADPTLSLTTLQEHFKKQLVDVKVLDYDGQGVRVQVSVQDTSSLQFIHHLDQKTWKVGEITVQDVLVYPES